MVEFKQDQIGASTVITCCFLGRLDTEECNKDAKMVDSALNGITTPVVFDLQKVEYVSSAFLRICIQTVKKLGKDNFSIVNVPTVVMKVLKIAGLDSILTIK